MLDQILQNNDAAAYFFNLPQFAIDFIVFQPAQINTPVDLYRIGDELLRDWGVDILQ
ncbi:hypothetical protein [Hydrogenoanaerobacterium sp.]|uniref:hypothetical protein n=1 Tax=Hydrogenoanaerobacterium sp. TaxID=2953763 RepID=UPI00289DCF38|nr:hypothetical protein [Hydrogenoanaerobacterium sp.]